MRLGNLLLLSENLMGEVAWGLAVLCLFLTNLQALLMPYIVYTVSFWTDG